MKIAARRGNKLVWTKLDDRFWSNPKIVSLDPVAFRLYVMALNWSVSHLTDGHVPEHVIAMFATKRARFRAEELIGAGLWERSENGGYVIHDFCEYQPTKSLVAAQRQATRERVQRHRAKQDGEVTEDVTRYKRVSNGVSNGARNTAPTRPDPITPPTVVASQQRGELFNAMFAAWFNEEYTTSSKVTKSARGEINAAVKQLAEVGATPEEIRLRAKRYRELWPSVAFTPSALVKHWETFTGENSQCSHRWSDGRNAVEATTRAGIEIRRCNRCAAEVAA